MYHIGYKMGPQGIGMRVKEYRERRRLTQEALAERAGISRTYLARLETGKHDPTANVLKKLAKALGIKVGRLID
jgi:transcriptional regulator with XRE-family HTH domain